jgi:glycosyltransferase involved in cell wall biosynthesis
MLCGGTPNPVSDDSNTHFLSQNPVYIILGMEQKKRVIKMLVSARFLSMQQNGISRDAKTIISELKKSNRISLLELESSTNILNGQPFHRLLRIIKTIFSRKPTFYSSGSSYSFILQIDNLLPNVKATAFIRVHDIFPITNAHWYRFLSAISFKISLDRAVRDNHKFVCNSEYTRSQLIKFYPSANAEVLYCNPARSPLDSCGNCDFCSKPHLFDYNYVIAVGTIEPRKNYSGLIRAWKNVCKSTDRKLIVVGRYGWKAKKIFKKLQNTEGLIYIDNACDYAVNQLLLKSEAFISCYLDEGFDFPSVDAALLNKPVVLSDIPVHRELHGGTATYFNPSSVEEIQKILTSKDYGFSSLGPDFISVTQDFEENLTKILDINKLQAEQGKQKS